MFGPLVSGAGMLRVAPVRWNSNVRLDTANLRYGTPFVAESSSVEGYALYSLATGTGVTMEVALHAATPAGFPTGAALATHNTSPAGDVWASNTFSSPVSVTAGNLYVLVARNTSATPASNFPSILTGTPTFTTNQSATVWANDGGTFWMYQSAAASMPLALFPRYDVGYRAPNWLARYNGSSVNLFGNRVVGMLIRSPIRLRLHGVVATLYQLYNNPAGNLVGTVRNAAGGVLSTSSNSFRANVNSYDSLFRWATPFEMLPNTDYYVGVATENGTEGDAGKYWNYLVQTSSMPATSGLYRGGMYWNGSAWEAKDIAGLSAYVEATSNATAGRLHGGFDL